MPVVLDFLKNFIKFTGSFWYFDGDGEITYKTENNSTIIWYVLLN